MIFSGDNPLYQISPNLLMNCDCLEDSLGPNSLMKLFTSLSHILLSGPKHATPRGYNVSVTWGGNLIIVMSSFSALSIAAIDIWVR